MAQPTEKEVPSPSSVASNDAFSGSDIKEVQKDITKRQSKELYIALCGPIGSGVHEVSNSLISVLENEGYQTHELRVSKLIKQFLDDMKTKEPLVESPKYDRFISYMEAGNSLRSQYGNAFCANLAIHHISFKRHESSTPKDSDSNDKDTKLRETGLKKTAYIINQLKHPDEVNALKQIYKNNFYLVGALCDEERRETSLTTDGISKGEANILITKDKADNDSHGQQLEKTIYSADFFINNSAPNTSSITAQLQRFSKLVHGQSGVTPTREEIGMYAAFSASLQSACLSRQVGAAIQDNDGAIIATGRNDVPKYGGGLYSEDDHSTPNSSDFRCIHRDKVCQNDRHKLLIKNDFIEILKTHFNNTNEIEKIAQELYRSEKIKSLIEYSRAIHAEMDALITLSRKGHPISKGSTLYTTTYPCHNCARHIIASGVEKIIYIEPYEKSLAIKLHDDAISHVNTENKVYIAPFQGVSPRRYQVFFNNTTPKKDQLGKVIASDSNSSLHVHEGYIDPYIDYETKVAESVAQLIKEIPKGEG